MEKMYLKSKHKTSRSRETKGKYVDIKTPPLPSTSEIKIEDLLNKRKTLKEKLKILEESEPKQVKQKRQKVTSNNINIESPVDSEDEEALIERRRKQRKQLLEKLKISSNTNSEEINSDSSNIDSINETQKTIINKVQNKDKVQNAVTDMFSERDEIHLGKSSPSNKNCNVSSDDWDDPQGFYIVKEGDVLNSRYTIKSTLGQGMFANVVRALDKSTNADVAIKIARNHNVMYKNGLKEIKMIRLLNDSDPNDEYHCIRMLRNFMHKKHLCIVLESLNMDLRRAIGKYGKSYGLNLNTAINYSKQLFSALVLLKKCGIIHADIKPDNIMVNVKENIIKLCDFGSAEKNGYGHIRAYLVSRFYRAPEIILGIPYGHEIDLWSTACTIYELATGRLMFTGDSNNKMLKCFMDIKGRLPSRIIRKGKYRDRHFNQNNNFILHDSKEKGKYSEIKYPNITRRIHNDLKKYIKSNTVYEERKIDQLRDLLERMFCLDPSQRPSLTNCLKHCFITEKSL